MHTLVKTPFYFVRHGQTDWNLEGRAMGQKDIPLNAHGIHQAKNSRGLLKGLGIQTICYSPLLRAKMTAEIYNEVLQCPLIPIEELQEFNLGSYSGQLIGSWFDQWRAGKSLEGAEHYSEFTKRSLQGVNKSLEHQGPVLVIAHGGIYWAIEQAMGVKLEVDLPNCVPVHHTPPTQQLEKWKPCLIQ